MRAYTRWTMTGAAPDALGPAPCDACKWRERCGVERLACERFSMFLGDEPVARWRAAPCTPSRARYEALLNPDGPKMGRPRAASSRTLRE